MKTPKLNPAKAEEEFMQAFNNMKQSLKGDMGIMGLEGRCPMHVSRTQPIDRDSEIGDLWYQP